MVSDFLFKKKKKPFFKFQLLSYTNIVNYLQAVYNIISSYFLPIDLDDTHIHV